MTSYLIGLVGSGIGPSLSAALHEREADELGLRYLYRRLDLDELAPDAAALGAVNTVVFHEGLTTGHNTDATGFARNLAVARNLRESGAPLLEIPGNYYDGLEARFDLPFAAELRENSVLYERDSSGEFLHFCIDLVGSRVFSRWCNGSAAQSGPLTGRGRISSTLNADDSVEPQGLPCFCRWSAVASSHGYFWGRTLGRSRGIDRSGSDGGDQCFGGFLG
ncbi:hypothetical protein [Amycolatopsis thailandensis]|uniref:hypothetical protein n=1 Tax=Amycolatopsis thailandensis TaxID=589330 RepID=UPI001FC90D67|nr:hypothetical protein [Amycolatopsis thailandensis]